MSTTAYDFPGADVYAGAETAANTAYGNALVRLNQQRQSTLNQYGYMGDIDPNSGALTNMRVDPNNPYGQYQQTLRGGAQESEAATDDAAGRGLSGGLAQQGQTQAKYDFGKATNALGTSLTDTLGGYDTSQTDADNQRVEAVTSAREQAAAAALQYQLSQTVLGPATGSSDPGAGGPTVGQPGYTPPLVGTEGQSAPGYQYDPKAGAGTAGKYGTGGGQVTYQSKTGNRKPLT